MNQLHLQTLLMLQKYQVFALYFTEKKADFSNDGL